MSIATIIGHLGRDAEVKPAGGTSVCKFNVAVTTKKKDGDSTAWYACSFFGTRGEKLAPYLLKGTAVCVSGELVPREYKGKNDELRTSLDLNVHSFSFAGGGEKAEKPAAAHYGDSEVPF